jgi:hypothetical protein
MEPIARLSLEGGYDSNPLYDGGAGARSGRISPDVGLRLRSPLWDVRGTYGGELVYFDRDAAEGTWNHRAGFALAARPTRRTALSAGLQFSEAIDPAGLARVGVFRTGSLRAMVLTGRGRIDWRASRRIDGGLTLTEQTVRFEDGSGGAVHAPGAEALWRLGRRLRVGGAYGLGIFQSFRTGTLADDTALSHALRARLRWQATRHVSLSAYAGPALWRPGGADSAVVPEAFAEVLLATRGLDLRASLAHGLGIGASADPGLVDALEVGGERRFRRRWYVRGDGGLWRSGRAPTGADAVTGYAIGGEGGIRLENDVRLALTAARYGRVDSRAPEFDRTTMGLRVGWELPARR